MSLLLTSTLTGSDSFICRSPYFRFLTVPATKTNRNLHAGIARHHLRTIQTTVENVYVWLVGPQRPVSER